jgi:hypothetical protein
MNSVYIFFTDGLLLAYLVSIVLVESVPSGKGCGQNLNIFSPRSSNYCKYDMEHLGHDSEPA